MRDLFLLSTAATPAEVAVALSAVPYRMMHYDPTMGRCVVNLESARDRNTAVSALRRLGFDGFKA